MSWLRFKCKKCGRTGPSGSSIELPFLHYPWYTDHKGLVHWCLYCRSCGTVYDTIGPLLGVLKALFGIMPSKIVATFGFSTLKRLARIGNPDFPSLHSVHPAILMAMEEDGRFTEAEDLTENPSLEFLVECLSDSDSVVRREAITALGRLGDTRAVEPLMEALKDRHWDVRRNAAIVLGEMGDTRAIEALDQLLLNEKWEAYVRREAKTALEKLRGSIE